MRRTIYTTPALYPLLKWIAKVNLALFGWRVVGELPNLKKMVVIGAPHTSNWDFVLGLAVIFAARWKFHWVAKHTLFKPPLGWLMRWLGGSPVDRSKSSNTVEAYIKLFIEHDEFALLIAPEGTRSRRDYWKSGFYHVAHGANVPILLAFIDKATKTCGLAHHLMPSGDIGEDMGLIASFYADQEGLVPENYSTPRIEQRPAKNPDRQEET